MGFVELDDGTRVHTSQLIQVLPVQSYGGAKHVLDSSCWCGPHRKSELAIDVADEPGGVVDVQIITHNDFVDCEGLPADSPAHEGKWDTKEGPRTCSWCGVDHPEDD